MQHVIIFEGHDKAGKTTLARYVSQQLEVPYFKDLRTKSVVKRGESGIVTKYAGIYMGDFFAQTGTSAIIDRAYPSEFAYSGALRRKIDLPFLMSLDRLYSSFDTCIVICEKQNGNVPDDDMIDKKYLRHIVAWYDVFAKWTQCHVIRLVMDDENTAEQYDVFMKEYEILKKYTSPRNIVRQFVGGK